MDDIVVDRGGNMLNAGPTENVIIDAPRVSVLPQGWPERAALQPDGSVILTLEYPKTLKMRDGNGNITDGASYKSFHLKRLTGEHKIKMRSLLDKDFEASVLSFSTGIDLAQTSIFVPYLDAADVGSILKVINFFQKPGPITGP